MDSLRINKKGIDSIRIILAIALVSLLAVSAFEVMNNGHEVKWTFTLGPSGHTGDYYSTQVANGTAYVYVFGSTQTVYALGPDGMTKWSIGVESYPVVSPNGTVYVQKKLAGGEGPSLCAYAPNGRLAWSYEVANGTFEQTTITPDGTVYTDHHLYPGGFTGYGFEFTALSSQGHLLWKQWSPYAPPYVVTDNGTILLANFDGNLTAYSPNGSVLWMKPLHQFFNSPVMDNGIIYTVDNLDAIDGEYADLCAIDLNGSLLWRYPGTAVNSNAGLIQCTSNPIIDSNGIIYFVRYNRTGANPYSSLFAINPNGTLRWEYRDSEIGTPAIHGDMVVFGSSSGLTELDLNGHVLWKVGGIFDVSYAHPAIGSDGTVYATIITGANLLNDPGVVAVGENPIVLEIGALFSLPIIATCLAILWKAKKGKD